jgi:hypothetical protein
LKRLPVYEPAAVPDTPSPVPAVDAAAEPAACLEPKLAFGGA